MKKKIVRTIIASLLATTLVAGCGSSGNSGGSDASDSGSSDEVTLTWAVFETDNYTADVWQHIIDSYEADNPGVKIEKVLMTGDSRPQFLKTMLAAGNMPDINIDPVDLAKTDGIYAEVPEELLEKYEEATIPTYNGKHTLIPAYKALRTQCFYHKDQFEEAGITKEPETWEEFLEVCQKLQDAGKTPIMGVGASDIWATSFGFWTGVVNSEIMSKYPDFNEQVLSGELSWTYPVIEDTLNEWKKLIDVGYYHEGSMSFSNTQATEEFKNGSAAMFMDGSWSALTYDNEGLTTDDIGVFVVPTPSGAKTYCTMPQYWAVSDTCENKGEAFKFCEYVLGGNEEIYTYYLQADGTYSVTKDPVEYDMGSIQKEFFDNYEGYELVPEIMKTVGDNAMPSGFEDFTLKSLQNIFTGSDVAKELSTWDAEMDKLNQASTDE